MRTLFLAALAALVFAAPVATTTQPASAKTCMSTNYTQTGSVKRTRAGARSAARNRWRFVVGAHHGGRCNNWSLAIVRSVVCSRVGRRHQCTARARPCCY